MKTLIENAIIVTMDKERRVIEQGYVLIKNDQIIDVQKGTFTEDKTEIECIDASDKIIIPGLINAHTHSFGNLVRGATENLPLELWLMYSYVEGKHMEAEDYGINALLGSIETLKSGTTTFLDHIHLNEPGLKQVFEQYKRIGTRAIIAPLFSDRPFSECLPPNSNFNGEYIWKRDGVEKNTRDWTDIIANLEHIIQTFSDPRVTMGVGPGGPHRCTNEVMVASMDLALKYDIPWHTHLLETKLVKYSGEQIYGQSMVEHLAELGILNEQVSFAHSVWLREADIQLIYDNDCSVVHNPSSNLYLGSGVMSLITLKEAGINLALGTDSSHCSGSQSLFEPMKLAATLSNITTGDYSSWVKAIDILEMATLGGARALGMEDEIGSIEKGKKADLVFINKNSVDLIPLNDVIWQLVYGRADTAISRVIVDGKTVVKDNKMTKLDEQQTYDEATIRAKNLLEKGNKDYSLIEKETKQLARELKTFNNDAPFI